MHYRKEIDGLRAVAVVPIILFHAGFSIFSGGYVGVDIFFVISGYLITSILIEALENKQLSLIQFYERRARRILPALFVVMLACIPFAYLWMLPSQLADFGQSLVAVVFFASNVLFWIEEGYFAAASELKPLLHTWSLAVEEQFYIVFPVFLMLVWRSGRRFALWSVAAVVALSFLLAEWGWRHEPTANFYLAPARAWELLAGSICSFLTVRRTQWSNNLLGALGLALVLYSIFAFDEKTPFPSAYTLAPVGGTALIILFAGQGTWVARLLSTPVFVGIGLISYSAYLWHQPLFAFARLSNYRVPDSLTMAMLCIATLILAWATWYFVEQPFRRREHPLHVTRRSLALGAGVMAAALLSAGLVFHFEKGFRSRADGVNLAKLEKRVEINFGLHRDCEGRFNDSENCRTSDTPSVLLWGDSFAMHLLQGIMAGNTQLGLQQHTKSSCAPVLGLAMMTQIYTERWARGCIDFNEKVLEWLKAHDSVDLVILSSPYAQLFQKSVLMKDGSRLRDPGLENIAEAMKATADAIRATGAKVVIVSPTPESGQNNGQCILRSKFFGATEEVCNFPLTTETQAFELLRSVQDEIPVFWVHEEFCTSGECDVIMDDIFVFRDGGHLSKEGSAHLGLKNNWLEKFYAMAK